MSNRLWIPCGAIAILLAQQASADLRSESADLRSESADLRSESADFREVGRYVIRLDADLRSVSVRAELHESVDRLIARDGDPDRLQKLEGCRGEVVALSGDGIVAGRGCFLRCRAR